MLRTYSQHMAYLREKISAEEWNRRVARIQEVKAEFLTGGLGYAEYAAKLDRV